MAFESSGADYLRKLKQDLHPAPAFEESTVAPSPAASADGKQERRINPRYKCEGSAEFRTEGSDVRTWGTFADLSLGGCYVEMKATFPVGALVDLTLDLNDVRVQVKGEVRISYPFLGIGIAFRDISPENQLHLKQMIHLSRHFRGSSARSRNRFETQFPAHHRQPCGRIAGAGGLLRNACRPQQGGVFPGSAYQPGIGGFP